MSERDAIVAMLRDCPEPLVNAMMEARVRAVQASELGALALSDQIRTMLLVVAAVVEKGDHLESEGSAMRPPWHVSHDAPPYTMIVSRYGAVIGRIARKRDAELIVEVVNAEAQRERGVRDAV